VEYKLTSRDCDKYFSHKEAHEYRGYNKALGKYITGKEHFIHEMNKGGFVPYEVGLKMAEQRQKETATDYKSVSPKTLKTIHQLKETVGRNGKLSSKTGTKKAMEDCGVRFDYYSKLPSHYQDIKTGGFDG
jgi:hypothetical protein